MNEKPKTLPETQIDYDALAWVLGTPNGRKVIWDLLAVSGLYRNPRVIGDTEGTYFNCGNMNMAQVLFADCMTVSPELSAMMIKEQGNADRTAAQPQPDTRSGLTASEPDTGEPGSASGFGFDRGYGWNPEPPGDGN